MTIFIEIGFFDERMGVGAKYGAGEDGDFFLESVNDLDLLYLISIYTHFIRLPIRNLQQFL